MNAIRILLAGSIDYAGLFPPAELGMVTAVRNYAQYRTSSDSWALGRFVVPASRLGEFETAAAPYLKQGSSSPWPLSVLGGADLDCDLEILTAFNKRPSETRELLRIDAIEVKATSESAIEDISGKVPRDFQTYIEVPIADDPGRLLRSISRRGGRAKVRTGGVTNDAFPLSTDLLRFIRGCSEAALPFKATAGLHHPIAADYRLTYAEDSPIGGMFGFLNLFLATAFVRSGMGDRDAALVLEETSPEAFFIGEREITWRHHKLDLEAVRALRKDGMISFGSCSFTEPLSDLEALGLLPPQVYQA